MPVENIQSFEQDQDKYKDFRNMLADASISQEEVEDLQARYDTECEEVTSETIWLCGDLLKEVEQYKEMTQMSIPQVRTLQKLIQIPASQRDWLRWPKTYAQYQAFIDAIWSDAWPKELAEAYEDIFAWAQQMFESLSHENRKILQREVWAGDDGIFWPNTFGKISTAVYTNPSLKIFFNFQSSQKIAPEVWQVEETTIPEPEIEERLEWKSEDSELKQGIWEPKQETDTREEEFTVINNLSPDEDVIIEVFPEQQKDIFKEQSKLYSGWLIRQLQDALWDIAVDGAFWNQSATRILEKHPELTNLEEVFAAEWINTDIDGVLSTSKDIIILQENFRNLYGDYIDRLGSDLWLPDGFIEAIIKKETTYWKELNSDTWSKWLMQLTKWPFKDMHWDHGDIIWNDIAKVRRYQEVFRRLDIDWLLTVEIWDKWEATSRIPEDIVNHLKNIQDSNDISSVQKSIRALRQHLKWNSHEYDHETNMIIWSVYLAYQYDRFEGNIWNTARKYNGDKKINPKTGREFRRDYANTVQRYFDDLQK